MQEKELFEDYEMRVWQFTPKIYKIFGIATVLNFLLLFAVGQFNLLSARGCDTPYVGMVCQVLDSAYVASVFLGRDNEWVSKPYEKDELEDADITYIDVSEKLEYPAGYFALANPEQTTENLLGDNGEFPTTVIDPNNPISTTPSPGSNLIDIKPITPTPNSKIGNQDAPDLPYSIGNTPSSTKNKLPKYPQPKKDNSLMSNTSPTTLDGNKTVAGNKTPTPTPKPEITPSPSPTPADSQAEFNEKFNKKPLQDFAEDIIAKNDSTDPKVKVDLKQSFTIVMDGVLTKEGKLDTTKSKFVKKEGSDEMVNVAKSAIEAVNNSGLLSYLKDLGAEKVNFTLIQDDKQIFAIIRSDQATEEKAKSISSGLGLLISVAKGNVKEADVQMLLNSAKVNAQGKSFILNFAIPKEEAHKIIEQKLQEARQKKSQTKNNEVMKDSTSKSE